MFCAGGQAAGAATYDKPAEVAALEELLAAPGEPPPPQELIALSRLLSAPCDQVRWLAAQAQALLARPGQRQAAMQLIEAALKRGQGLSAGGHLAPCPDLLAALEALTPRTTALEAVTDPDELRQRLAEATDLVKLDPSAKFALLSRGVPAAKLLTRPGADDWDMPRVAVEMLTRDPVLPPFIQLRAMQQRLAGAYQRWTTQSTAGGPAIADAASQELVTATFQIAAALLDRALGLDGQDLAGRTLPVPYREDPSQWAGLAQQFDQAALWTWSTLAHVLALAPPPGQPATPDGLTAARNAWSGAQALNPELWPAVGSGDNAWLARLASPDRLVQPGMLPLARDFRAAAQSQRRQHEEEALRQVQAATESGNEQTANQLFQTIQFAKAADLGVQLEALTLDKLKTLFGGDATNQVYLFVEMIELRAVASGREPRFCGVALYRPEYRTRTAGDRGTYTDRYVAKILPRSASPTELVAAALAPPGPPQTTEGRVLIACDGPLPPDWFDFEKQTLLARTGGAHAPSWVVYLPSATVLSGEHWTLNETLRVWHRLGIRAGWPAPELASDAKPLGTRLNPGPPLSSTLLGGLTIECVWLDKAQPMPADQLLDFIKLKRERPIHAIPLWVRK